jgi:hypothetical protein
VLWSVESAGYATAIWIASLSVYAIQRAILWRELQLSNTEGVKRISQIIVTPMVALAAVVIVVTALYFGLFKVMPEWSIYLQGARVPAVSSDPTGPEWYLLLLFRYSRLSRQ